MPTLRFQPIANQREDIQVLRGYAVLIVLIYHAQFGLIEAGFLGVDIFFVISGFLITKLIKQQIERDKFRFVEFYFRRAKRLLPSAYATYFATTLFVPLFLTNSDVIDYVRQLIGALTFTANIVLWRQSGYFESAAELKPFLHIWSLAVEEQYYLILPAALVFVPKRFWISGTFIVLMASLVMCFIGGYWKPWAVFYLLPTRGWELAIGSTGALWQFGSRSLKIFSHLFWPALATIIAIPISPIGRIFPSIDAVAICAATLVLIIANSRFLTGSIPTKVVAKFGDFSYSLYLVHWPIFAFANNAYLEDTPTEARVIAFVLSVLIGYLLFVFIESPARRLETEPSKKILVLTVAASFGLVFLAVGLQWVGTTKVNVASQLKPNFGFGESCEFSTDFEPKKECQNSPNPRILVWGDSYAMHLVPGIVAASSLGVVQATRSVCGPLIGLAPINNSAQTTRWGENCIKFNASVLRYLAETESVEFVVLSSPFFQYLYLDYEGQKWQNMKIVDGREVINDPSISSAIDATNSTLSEIRKLGKKVVVVAPPPNSGVNIGKCLERIATGRVVFGNYSDCEISIDAYQKHNEKVFKFLTSLQALANVNVISFDAFLCNKQSCFTKMGETLIYRDKGHLSYDGSRLVAERMNLVQHILTEAK